MAICPSRPLTQREKYSYELVWDCGHISPETSPPFKTTSPITSIRAEQQRTRNAVGHVCGEQKVCRPKDPRRPKMGTPCQLVRVVAYSRSSFSPWDSYHSGQLINYDEDREAVESALDARCRFFRGRCRFRVSRTYKVRMVPRISGCCAATSNRIHLSAHLMLGREPHGLSK